MRRADALGELEQPMAKAFAAHHVQPFHQHLRQRGRRALGSHHGHGRGTKNAARHHAVQVSEQLRGGEALQDIDPKSLLEDEDLRFPAPLPPPAENRSKLDNLTGEKLIKSVAERLVNFQATAPAKPSPDYL